MKLTAIPMNKNKPILKFNHWSEALEQLKLNKGADSNIGMCVKDKLKSAYGYKWVIEPSSSE